MSNAAWRQSSASLESIGEMHLRGQKYRPTSFRRAIELSVSLIFCLYYCVAGNAQVAKLYPVDEAAKDPSFYTFRAQLLKTIQQKDSASLYGFLSPAIRNSFGDDNGVGVFKRMWKPELSTSKIWMELLTVLALGGKFEGERMFMAPYTYSNFPDQFDAFEYGAIVGDGVNVRRGPGTDHPIIRTLSFDIIRVNDWNWTPTKTRGEKGGWITVALSDGQKGYVAREYIRSPVDYRAIFNKENGRWVMTAFVAGD